MIKDLLYSKNLFPSRMFNLDVVSSVLRRAACFMFEVSEHAVNHIKEMKVV